MSNGDEDKTVQIGGAGGTGKIGTGGREPPLPPDKPPNVLLLVGILLLVAVLVWMWRSGLVAPDIAEEEAAVAAAGATGATDTEDSAPQQGQTGDLSPVDERQQEAEEYVADIRAEAATEEVDVHAAKSFIGADSVIRIRAIGQECVDYQVDELNSRLGLSLDAEVKVWIEREQVVYRTVQELLQAGLESGDNAAIPLWRAGEVQPVSVAQLRSDYSGRADEKLAVLGTELEPQIVTVRELIQDTDSNTVCISTDIRPEAVTLRQIMPGGVGAEDDLYYVYTVDDDDVQGLWGIIHTGIIDNFARGIALRREETVSTYQVEIPRRADEQVSATESSFLGRIIDRKVRESFIYNHEENRMGTNPDLLVPGQEVAVFRFTQEEMIDIYQYFAAGGR